MKYSGLSEDVTWRSKLESGSNKREFGWLCVCHVLVERCWCQDQDQGLQTQGELNETELPKRLLLFREYSCKYIKCVDVF